MAEGWQRKAIYWKKVQSRYKAVQSALLEVIKTQLSTLVWPCLERRGGTREPPKVPPSLNYPMILLHLVMNHLKQLCLLSCFLRLLTILWAVTGRELCVDLQDSHRKIHLDGPFHLFTSLVSSFPTDKFVEMLTVHFSSHPWLKFVLVRKE